MSAAYGILKLPLALTGATLATKDELDEITSEIVATANHIKCGELVQMMVFRPNLCITNEDSIRMVSEIEKEGHQVTLCSAGVLKIVASSLGCLAVAIIWGPPGPFGTDDDAGVDDDIKSESAVNSGTGEDVTTPAQAVAKVQPKIVSRATVAGDDDSETESVASYSSDKEVNAVFKFLDKVVLESEDEAEDHVGASFTDVDGVDGGESSADSSYEDYHGVGLTQEAYIPSLAELEMPEPSPAPLRRSARNRSGN